MIYIKTFYGVSLTDEFGGFFKLYDGFIELNLNDFCVSCPSVEDSQYVLGINVDINKNMDIKEINNQWEKYIQNLPQNVKDIISEITLNNKNAFEPDFKILAGEI